MTTRKDDRTPPTRPSNSGLIVERKIVVTRPGAPVQATRLELAPRVKVALKVDVPKLGKAR